MHNMRRNARTQRSLRRCVFRLILVTYTPAYASDSAQSTLTNKSRLKLLQQREEHLQDLFATARSSIVSLSSSEDRYVQFLENVITQGLLALLETDAVVLARDNDVDVVKKAAENAERQYQDLSGKTVTTRVQGGLSADLCVLKLSQRRMWLRRCY